MESISDNKSDEEDEFFGDQSSDDDNNDDNYNCNNNNEDDDDNLHSLSKYEIQAQEQKFHNLGYHEAYDEYKETKIQLGFEEGLIHNFNHAFDIGLLLGECVFREQQEQIEQDKQQQHLVKQQEKEGQGKAAFIVRQFLEQEQVKDGGGGRDGSSSNSNSSNNRSGNKEDGDKHDNDDMTKNKDSKELEQNLKEILQLMKQKAKYASIGIESIVD